MSERVVSVTPIFLPNVNLGWFAKPVSYEVVIVSDDEPVRSKGTGGLSLEEAAEEIGISLTTAKKLVKSGDLRTYTVGRRRLVRRSTVETYIADREAGRKRRSKLA